MKKKIFGGIAVLAFAAIVGMNVKMNSQDNKLADLSLANVEALGDNEDDNNKAHSMFIMDEGKRDECINGQSICCQYYHVSCLGSGNIDCKGGYHVSCQVVGTCSYA